ncbi:hypothetical protein [Noviherbaspirillum agri]
MNMHAATPLAHVFNLPLYLLQASDNCRVRLVIHSGKENIPSLQESEKQFNLLPITKGELLSLLPKIPYGHA